MNTQFKILGISGSLRKASLNSLFLRAMKQLTPAHINFNIYTDLPQIPIFNPDLTEELYSNIYVNSWREAISQADLILLVSPEYAHGVSGSMKNALDWIVESGEFTDKLVAFPNLSIRTDLAYKQLFQTLIVMGASIVNECSPQATLDAPYILNDSTELNLINHSEIKRRYQTLWDAIDYSIKNNQKKD